MAPSNGNECYQMLNSGFKYEGICAVRYPRGFALGEIVNKKLPDIPIGKAIKVKSGEKIAILAFGSMVNICEDVADELDATLINMRFIKPIDKRMIKIIAKTHDLIVTVEDNAVMGGAGSSVLEVISDQKIGCETLSIGIPDKFIEHGTQNEVYAMCGLNKASIIKKIVKHINK
jgi:1-deoxy-D-xylulose-5-phosphate synthase